MINNYILNSTLIMFLSDVWFVIVFLLFLLFGIFKSLNPNLNKDYFSILFKFILSLWIIISFLNLIFYFSPTELEYNLILINGLNYTKYTLIVKLFILVGSYLFVPIYEKNINSYELYTIYSLIIIGLVVLVLSSNFLVFYLGLELQSLALYILIAYKRSSSLSIEASLKYYILGALASGILLLGMSFIYGYFGTLNFNELALIISSSLEFRINKLVLISILLIITTFLFKLSIAPFHNWAPDVYEASTIDVIGLISIVSKLAVFFTLIRLIFGFMYISEDFVSYFIFSTAFLSIIIGNFAGLFQTNLKRLFAYSTISHMGFILLGLSSFDINGLVSSIFYILVYSLTTLSLLFILNKIKKSDGSNISDIRELAGLSIYNPILSYIIGILLLSLAGLPPLGGFFIKYYVILQVAESWGWIFSFFIIFISIIGSFYYLYIIYIFLFISILPKSKIMTHLNNYILGSKLQNEFLQKGYQPWLYFDSLNKLNLFNYFIFTFTSIFSIFIIFFISDLFYICYDIIQYIITNL